ncbi:hypothetical protein D3C71_1937550 [compost metagenome]
MDSSFSPLKPHQEMVSVLVCAKAGVAKAAVAARPSARVVAAMRDISCSLFQQAWDRW